MKLYRGSMWKEKNVLSPKVSIVVPVLNSVLYIEECIMSIRNQTMSEIEIIIVDAGSTDGTLEILKKMVQEDKRIILLHSERKSCGYQNNVGVEKASGKYIGFVESDDIISENMYEELFSEAEEKELEYIKADFDTFYFLKSGEKVTERQRGVPPYAYNKILSGAEYPELLLYDIYLWKGIYRADFLKKYHIEQNITLGAAFQDVGFAFQTITQVKRGYYSDKVFYHYRRDNQNSSVYNINGYIFLKNEFLFIEKFLERHSELNGFWKEFYLRLSAMVSTRDKIMTFSNVEWKEVVESLGEIGKIFQRGIKQGRIDLLDFGEQRWAEVQMVIKYPEQYYYYSYFKYNELAKSWDVLMKECKQARDVVIFGCGIRTRRLFAMMERNDINVSAFCDNDERKWGTLCCGKEIYSPQVVRKWMPDALFLVLPKYGNAMKKQLLDMGVESKKIKLHDVGNDISCAFVYRYRD